MEKKSGQTSSQVFLALFSRFTLKKILFSYLNSHQLLLLALACRELKEQVLCPLFYNDKLYALFFQTPMYTNYPCFYNDDLYNSVLEAKAAANCHVKGSLQNQALTLSKTIAELRTSLQYFFNEQGKQQQFFGALVRLLRQPQISLPPLKRNNIGRYAKTPLQNFMSMVLQENDQVRFPEEDVFEELRSKFQSVEGNLEGVSDLFLLKMRYEQVDHQPQSSGDGRLDLVQALSKFISTYVYIAAAFLEQDKEWADPRQRLVLFLTRHSTLTYFTHQEKLGFAFQWFQKEFQQRFPGYPFYPNFKLWRVVLKNWVSAYQQKCHHLFVDAFSDLLNSRLHGYCSIIEKEQKAESPELQEEKQLLQLCSEALLDLSIDQISVHFLEHTAQKTSFFYNDLGRAFCHVQAYVLSKCQDPAILAQISEVLAEESKLLRPCQKILVESQLRQTLLDRLQKQYCKHDTFNQPPDRDKGPVVVQDLLKLVQGSKNQGLTLAIGRIADLLKRNDSQSLKVDSEIAALNQDRGLSLTPEPLQQKFYSLRNLLSCDLVKEVMKQFARESEQEIEEESEAIEEIEEYNSEDDEEPPVLMLRR